MIGLLGFGVAQEGKPLGLEVEGLCKTWRGFQLRNISLTIGDGEYLVLLGPTGAGKTLLLETIMGFHKPDSGKISLNDKDITDVPPEKRGIGYVSQNCVLFPHLDVSQNIEFGLKMAGTEAATRKKRVDVVLESTGLKPLEHRRSSTLSGGEAQKVALARVLVMQPSTILLDEPLSALDTEASRDFKKQLKSLRRDGKTVIHVTHNLVEAFSLGDRLAIQRAGEIVQVGKTSQVFAEPKDAFVARLLGYENVFNVEVVESRDTYSIVKAREVKFAVDEKLEETKITVAIRPEDISLHLAKVSATKGLNVLEATVNDCADQGHTVTITCDAGMPMQAITSRSAYIEANIKEDQKIWLTFKAKAVKILR